MGSEGVMGAEEDKGAPIYLMLDGQDTTGIGYMAEEDEGAIGADWAMGAEEDEEAALHISLDGYDTMGIGYMA